MVISTVTMPPRMTDVGDDGDDDNDDDPDGNDEGDDACCILNLPPKPTPVAVQGSSRPITLSLAICF